MLPVGRVSAAAQQAKAPFHNLDVSLGQYELSTTVQHQAPSLQVCSLLQLLQKLILSCLTMCLRLIADTTTADKTTASCGTPIDSVMSLRRVYQHTSELAFCMQCPLSPSRFSA